MSFVHRYNERYVRSDSSFFSFSLSLSRSIFEVKQMTTSLFTLLHTGFNVSVIIQSHALPYVRCASAWAGLTVEYDDENFSVNSFRYVDDFHSLRSFFVFFFSLIHLFSVIPLLARRGVCVRVWYNTIGHYFISLDFIVALLGRSRICVHI